MAEPFTIYKLTILNMLDKVDYENTPGQEDGQSVVEIKDDQNLWTDDVLNVLKTFDSKTTIGFQTGTTGQQYSENKGDYESNGLKLSTKPYQSAVLAVQDMLHGNLDYVIVDAAPAASITASINGTK